MFVKY